MTAKDLSKALNYSISATGNMEGTVTNAYVGDLLSDVMGNASTDSVLITIQAHKNTVAVASLIGCPVIILCNGRSAPADMVEAAESNGITLLETTDTQYKAACRIATLLGSI